MTRCMRTLASILLLALGLTGGSAVAGEGTASDPGAVFDAEWSTRLLQEKARIERWRKRLDKANAAYAKAVGAGESGEIVAKIVAMRDAAAKELQDARRTLPALVEEAREEGVSSEILKPYRFAVSPEDAP